MPVTTPPAGWYINPDDATQQRYWDGSQWTTHVAPGEPGVAALAPRRSRRGLVASIIALVALVLVAGTWFIWLFFDQREARAERAAADSVLRVANEITTMGIDHPDQSPMVGQMGASVVIEYPDGAAEVVSLNGGVSWGGYVETGDHQWCIWVRVDGTPNDEWQYDTLSGTGPGSCQLAD